jgi:hypothetical protein
VYYRVNKDKIRTKRTKRRLERYHSDSAYRKRLLERARSGHQKNRAERNQARRDKYSEKCKDPEFRNKINLERSNPKHQEYMREYQRIRSNERKLAEIYLLIKELARITKELDNEKNSNRLTKP